MAVRSAGAQKACRHRESLRRSARSLANSALAQCARLPNN